MAVVDTGGAGGTRVNGDVIERAELKPGDRIELGRSVVTYLRSEEDEGLVGVDESLSSVFEASKEAKQAHLEAARRVADRERSDPRKRSRRQPLTWLSLISARRTPSSQRPSSASMWSPSRL